MSKNKNGGLDQYTTGLFKRQQFVTAGVEGVNMFSGVCPSVCPICALTFKSLNLETSFLVCRDKVAYLGHEVEVKVAAALQKSLPKVIWEDGHVAALLHTCYKSPLVTMARPKFASKSAPSRGPIPKPHYLPHPWTCQTYDAKRHPDPILHFATIHWTDRPIDAHMYRPTDRPLETLATIGHCATRATRPKNTRKQVVYIRPKCSLVCFLKCYLLLFAHKEDKVEHFITCN